MLSINIKQNRSPKFPRRRVDTELVKKSASIVTAFIWNRFQWSRTCAYVMHEKTTCQEKWCEWCRRPFKTCIYDWYYSYSIIIWTKEPAVNFVWSNGTSWFWYSLKRYIFYNYRLGIYTGLTEACTVPKLFNFPTKIPHTFWRVLHW